MQVKELREILKDLADDMPVVAAKFEFGFDDISEYRIIELVLNVNQYQSESSGPHDLKTNVEIDGHQSAMALLLGELEPSVIKARSPRRNTRMRSSDAVG